MSHMTPASESVAPVPKSVIHLSILDRLRKITLVHQALMVAQTSYDRIKSSNAMIGATLSHAESMANLLAILVLNKFEQPIHWIDSFACQSFDKIHSGVTILSQNQVVSMVQKRYDDTVQFVQSNSKQIRTILDNRLEKALQQTDSIRKQMFEHVNSVMKVLETVIKSVDKSLTAAENALDRLLPPLKPEPVESTDQDQSNNGQQPIRRLFQRMVRFSDKLRRRIVQYTLEKWSTSIKQSGLNFRENILSIISSQLSNLRLQLNNNQTETKLKQS